MIKITKPTKEHIDNLIKKVSENSRKIKEIRLERQKKLKVTK